MTFVPKGCFGSCALSLHQRRTASRPAAQVWHGLDVSKSVQRFNCVLVAPLHCASRNCRLTGRALVANFSTFPHANEKPPLITPNGCSMVFPPWILGQ